MGCLGVAHAGVICFLPNVLLCSSGESKGELFAEHFGLRLGHAFISSTSGLYFLQKKEHMHRLIIMLLDNNHIIIRNNITIMYYL